MNVIANAELHLRNHRLGMRRDVGLILKCAMVRNERPRIIAHAHSLPEPSPARQTTSLTSPNAGRVKKAPHFSGGARSTPQRLTITNCRHHPAHRKCNGKHMKLPMRHLRDDSSPNPHHNEDHRDGNNRKPKQPKHATQQRGPRRNAKDSHRMPGNDPAKKRRPPRKQLRPHHLMTNPNKPNNRRTGCGESLVAGGLFGHTEIAYNMFQARQRRGG